MNESRPESRGEPRLDRAADDRRTANDDRNARGHQLDRAQTDALAEGRGETVDGRDPTDGSLRHSAQETAGTHALGATLGAIGGAAAGAVAGLAAGPIGSLAGAVAGALGGGALGAGSSATGSGPSVSAGPAANDAPLDDGASDPADLQDRDLDDDAARRYSRDAYRNAGPGAAFEAHESSLESGWETARGDSRRPWHEAKHAARDEWHRLARLGEDALPGDSDGDGH